MRTLIALVLGFSAASLVPSPVTLEAQGPPPAQAPAPCTPAGTVQFVCGLQAPEDLVVVPGEQWVVAGAYGGRGGIYLIHARDRKPILAYPVENAAERLDASLYKSCPGAPDAGTKAKFQTHGLFLLPGTNGVHRLFVVLHGGRESVEVFDVDARKGTPGVTWVGCVVAPEPIGLNSVRGLPDGGFIATNFLARGAGGGLGGPGMKAMMSGEKNGELWEWHAATGWQKLPGTETAGANGLELSPDGKTIYVAAWGTQSFYRVSRGATTPERNEIPLGFRVDNIRWSRDGSILAAGQGGSPAATIVVKIDPRTLAVRELVRHPDTPAYSAGTVAVEVGSDLWVGSFRGDRLAIFSGVK
jgi:sugar lactone lactonase YvrE